MIRGRYLRQLAGLIAVMTVVTVGCAANPPKSRLEPHYQLRRPEGPGPFPAIILVPGCGGVAPARVQTAEQLASQGYVAVFVDYIASRGLRTACRGEVSRDDIARDIDTVSMHLKMQPYVSAKDIGVVGWSLGGAAVLTGLALVGPGREPAFAAAAVFYPVCRDLAPWKVKVPVLVLLGQLDDITPPSLCEELIKMLPPGSPVDVRLFPGARHSFDNSDLAPVTASQSFPGRTIGFQAAASAEAWREVARLFDARLKGRS